MTHSPSPKSVDKKYIFRTVNSEWQNYAPWNVFFSIKNENVVGQRLVDNKDSTILLFSEQ